MTETPFSQALKAAREEAGLSQSALARRAGLTPSYLSLLESKKKRPPSPRVISALCRALGVDEEPLQEIAALERTPAPIRRRLLRIDRERGSVARSRDRILSTTLFHIAQSPIVFGPLAEDLGLSGAERTLLGRLLSRAKTVQSPDDAQAKSEEILQEAGPRERDRLVRVLPAVISGAPPVTEAAVQRVPLRTNLREESTTEEMTLPASMAGPDAFLWRVTTDDGWPRVETDDLVLIEPCPEPKEGDLVVFFDDGRVRIRSVGRQGDELRLTAPRAEVVPVRRRADAFAPVGAIAWVLRRTR